MRCVALRSRQNNAETQDFTCSVNSNVIRKTMYSNISTRFSRRSIRRNYAVGRKCYVRDLKYRKSIKPRVATIAKPMPAFIHMPEPDWNSWNFSRLQKHTHNITTCSERNDALSSQNQLLTSVSVSKMLHYLTVWHFLVAWWRLCNAWRLCPWMQPCSHQTAAVTLHSTADSDPML